jgi:hypothetical protein
MALWDSKEKTAILTQLLELSDPYIKNWSAVILYLQILHM